MAIFHSYWPYVSLPEGTKARQARCLVGVMSTKDIYLLLLVELQMERGPIAVLLVAWDIRRTQLVLMWAQQCHKPIIVLIWCQDMSRSI